MINLCHYSQDSLVLEATADGLSGEQTWPTEAEMNMGDSALETMDSNIGRNRRIVPTNVRQLGLYMDNRHSIKLHFRCLSSVT
jgi:hypothetical protein